MIPSVLSFGWAFLSDLSAATVVGLGTMIVLTVTPWFRRRSLLARVGPYVPRSQQVTRSDAAHQGFRTVMEPILDWLGLKLSTALGVVTDLETRLVRAGRPPDTYGFRLRQVVTATFGLATALVVSVVTDLSGPLAIVLILGAPVLVILAAEQALVNDINKRNERLRAELPVVLEQLGLLISSGFSLTSAIAHIGARSSGIAAADFRSINQAIRRGVETNEAINSWAISTGLDSVEKIGSVLALNSEAADLGTLISAEARSIRSDAHRELLETIERRAQLVWIPVTVATLVPGLIFLAVPFYAAMSAVTGG